MKFHATAPTYSFTSPNFMRSFCPECHDLMISAAMSQHVNADVIHHWWTCESCGHQFRTTVQLPPLQAQAAEAALA
jgi:RNase P subunit RPR2